MYNRVLYEAIQNNEELKIFFIKLSKYYEIIKTDILSQENIKD